MKSIRCFANFFLILFFFIQIYSVSSQEINISSEELASFRVTVYNKEEQIPFDNLLNLNGTSFDASRLKGKYILLNLGATWCPYCQKEKESLQRLYESNRSEQFIVLCIFVNDPICTINRYINENSYTFPIAVDVNDQLRKIYAPRIPTSYLINPAGFIMARINGNKEWESVLASRILDYFFANQ